MGFLRELERKVTRPIGKGLKKVAPIGLAVAGNALLPGAGAFIGGALGDVIKRGKLDPMSALASGGTGMLAGGIAGKLGATNWLSGKLATSGIPGVSNMAADAYAKNAGAKLAGSLGSSGLSAISGAAPKATGVGGAVREAAGEAASAPWWKDRATLGAIGQGAQAGAQLYSGMRQDAMERERFDYQRELEERERADRERAAQSMAPYAQELLAGMMRRIRGGGAGYVSGYQG